MAAVSAMARTSCQTGTRPEAQRIGIAIGAVSGKSDTATDDGADDHLAGTQDGEQHLGDAGRLLHGHGVGDGIPSEDKSHVQDDPDGEAGAGASLTTVTWG